MTPRDPAALVTYSTPVYWLGRNLCAVAIRLGCRLRIEGAEHVPRAGGVVVASNHQSYLDIPLVAAGIDRHVCFAARESLARSRFLAWIMRESGAVLVRRGTADKSAVEAMIGHARQGDCVAVFPEGTRGTDGRLGEFKPGAILVARRAGTPIVPCAIRGAYRVMGRGQRLPRPGPITVRFGPPLDPRAPGAQEALVAAIASMAEDGRDPRARR